MPYERKDFRTHGFKIMWPNGPTRTWSETKRAGCALFMDAGGFCGPYICQACQSTTGGVHARKTAAPGGREWVCGSCLDADTGKKPRDKKADFLPPAVGLLELPF